MKYKLLACFLGLLLLGSGLPAWAQLQNTNWYFGVNAAVRFPNGAAPGTVAGSAMNTYEACAAASDATGQLLFYTSGENIWTRTNQLMVNGTALGGHVSTTQGAAIVQNPANPQQYYVFSLDAAENLLTGGLKYSLVDMTKQGGLGEVLTARNQVSAVRLTEKLTTVPHANGRDTWVLVHGWQTNTFYAYLLTPAGLQLTPVTTNIGSVHNGGGGANGNANAVGYMRVSSDGQKLALGIRDQNFELFDFNPATGQLSNYVYLPVIYRSYGVEFSPDNHLLYGTDLDGLRVYQFNLQAGSAAAIASSRTVVGNASNTVGALKIGPDGKLYVAVFNSPYLAIIDNPNVLGTGCGYRASAVSLGGALSQVGLPNYPNSSVVVPSISFTSAGSCVGSAVAFAGTVTPAASGILASWNFGDAASGAANTATGLTPTHLYSTAGTYQVTFSVAYSPTSAPFTITQAVTVLPRPTVRLGRDTMVCGTQVVLMPNAQPVGSTYRWQDGSTSATYVAKATGRYRVAVTSAGGCTSADSVRVTLNAMPVSGLPAQVTACAFNVLLITAPQPTGTTYRWQDGSTSYNYLADHTGTYRVTITSPQGCSTTDSVRVTLNMAAPTPRLPADTTICTTSVLLRPHGLPATGLTYRWQDGSTGATYLAQRTGLYTVTVTTAQGCQATVASRVTLGTAPTVSLGADTLVCPTASFVLHTNPQPAGTLYRWQDGSTSSTFLAHGPGTYSVQVQTSAGGCTATATRVAGPANCVVTIPNIITPNGDALNEYFELKGLTAADWHLSVFDRWGRQVYDQARYDNRWNATGQSAGIYYYLLENATGQRYKGWVEVMRD